MFHERVQDRYELPSPWGERCKAWLWYDHDRELHVMRVKGWLPRGIEWGCEVAVSDNELQLYNCNDSHKTLVMRRMVAHLDDYARKEPDVEYSTPYMPPSTRVVRQVFVPAGHLPPGSPPVAINVTSKRNVPWLRAGAIANLTKADAGAVDAEPMPLPTDPPEVFCYPGPEPEETLADHMALIASQAPGFPWALVVLFLLLAGSAAAVAALVIVSAP
jgi:hypothetical protein